MAHHRPKTVRCASCDKEIKIPPTGRIAKYCSNACRQAAFYKNHRSPLSADEPATLADVGAIAGRRVGPERQAAATAQAGGRTMIRIATAIALVLLPSAALAQQQRETFKDANGRTLGWATSNGSGGTSYYNSSGRNTGRAVTGSNGSTTIYDAAVASRAARPSATARRPCTTRAVAVSAPPSKWADDMTHDHRDRTGLGSGSIEPVSTRSGLDRSR